MLEAFGATVGLDRLAVVPRRAPQRRREERTPIPRLDGHGVGVGESFVEGASVVAVRIGTGARRDVAEADEEQPVALVLVLAAMSCGGRSAATWLGLHRLLRLTAHLRPALEGSQRVRPHRSHARRSPTLEDLKRLVW